MRANPFSRPFSRLLGLFKAFFLSWVLLASVAQADTLVTPAAPFAARMLPMFDVTAINALTVQSLSASMVMAAAPQTISIYGRPGTHAGQEFTPASWTLLGQTTLAPIAAGVVDFPIPLNVPIAAGATYAFHIVTTNCCGVAPFNLSNNMTGSLLTADANLRLFAGVSMTGAFGLRNPDAGLVGKVTYCLAGTCPSPIATVPTLSEYGMMVLTMLVMAFGLGVIQRRQG
jgi:IPTL-CTERM motif